MKLDINGTEYHIHFRYGRYDGRRQTRCEVHSGQCTDSPVAPAEICGTRPKGVGFAYCSHLDEFVKSKGRKLALARAMQYTYDSTYKQLLGPPRAIRLLIWTAYLDATHEAVRR